MIFPTRATEWFVHAGHRWVLSATLVLASLAVAVSASENSIASASMQGFTTSARVSPAQPGATTHITAAVTNSDATSASALVDIEVYGPDSGRHFQQFFDNQSFGPRETRQFPVDWAVPSSAPAGTYHVVVAVFIPGWGTLQPWTTWLQSATPLSVGNSDAPATATTPTPTPTHVATSTPTAPPSASSPSPTPTSIPSEQTGFVTHQSPQFALNGAPFRFVGVNMYNAANDASIGFNCYRGQMSNPETELDDWFRRASQEAGASVIRVWAFQGYTAGGTNWTAFDRLFRLANRWGLKVLPVFDNEWADCTQGGVKGSDWYAGGYKVAHGSPLSYRDYVGRMVERYRDEPAVFGWSLMNEAESSSPDALYDFTRDMSTYIKSIDSNHMVTLGVQGRHQPGQRGADYTRLHSLATIDFAEYHDYGAQLVALPGQDPTSGWGGRAVSFDNSYGNYFGYEEGALPARQWRELRGIIQPGATRLGVDFYPDPANVGSVYIDSIQIGSRLIDFEDGGLDGAMFDGPVTLENSSAVAYSGSRSLRATFSAARENNVFVPLQPGDIGQPFTIRVYVDGPATGAETDSLVGRMRQMQAIGKPVVVAESGMTVGVSLGGIPAESSFDARAQDFDAKLTAFFANGGAGYLIWNWEPTARTPMDHAFTSGDPLNRVLLRIASQLK